MNNEPDEEPDDDDDVSDDSAYEGDLAFEEQQEIEGENLPG
jgi:hypothetical protein